MALDIKPTRSELIKLKTRIKQTKNGYKLLKMKRDGLFHEFRQLLSKMIEAKRDLTDSYRLAKQRIDLANAIDGGLAVRAAAIANSAHPEVEVERRNIMGVDVPSVSGSNLKSTFIGLQKESLINESLNNLLNNKVIAENNDILSFSSIQQRKNDQINPRSHG